MFFKERSLEKVGSKVRFLGQGDACNSVLNGPNELKFCIQGAFVSQVIWSIGG